MLSIYSFSWLRLSANDPFLPIGGSTRPAITKAGFPPLQTLQRAYPVEPYTFIIAPHTEIALAKLKAATTTEALPVPPALQRVTFKSTIHVPINWGGGTDESVVIAGNFRENWIGIRMQALVEVLREKYAANYQYGFQVSMRADVQFAHEAAFCALTGITLA